MLQCLAARQSTWLWLFVCIDAGTQMGCTAAEPPAPKAPTSAAAAQTNPASATANAPSAAQTFSGRKVSVLGGAVTLDLGRVPVIGPPDASNVVVALLDYTCAGCQILHAQLQEATKLLSNQVAVACLPAPLDGACNPSVTEAYPEHAHGCDYARLALAVWEANPRGFDEFEKGLWGMPPVDQARKLAALWVPSLATNQPNQRVEEQLRQGIDLYTALKGQIGHHAMPLLIIGRNLSMGSFPNTASLCAVLRDKLGLASEPAKPGPSPAPTSESKP